MNVFQEVITKLKLFWQYPVITEKIVFEQEYNNSNYYGIPWATILDKNYNLETIFKLLKALIPEKQYITCCQHIYFRNLIPFFKLLNIKTVYTPHKIKDEDEIDGVKIMACPLYAVNFEDNTRNTEFKNIIDFKNVERKYL